MAGGKIHSRANPIYVRRRIVNATALMLSIVATAIGLAALIWILWTLGSRGLGSLRLQVLTQNTPPPGNDGGLLNAIVGSLLMTGTAILIAAPVGILAATFLAEYGRNSRLADLTRFVSDVLLSAPSIVVGLFAYVILVATTKHFSAWAGVTALTVIAIPIVVRTTEDMLRLVPNSLREAAAALGAPRWKVITLVTYRAARSGIITGVLLAIARISGETAPLLFTALNNQFWSTDMSRPMANLPVVIFQFAMSPYEDWQHLAWAGALLITLGVLALNIAARSLFAKERHG